MADAVIEAKQGEAVATEDEVATDVADVEEAMAATEVVTDVEQMTEA